MVIESPGIHFALHVGIEDGRKSASAGAKSNVVDVLVCKNMEPAVRNQAESQLLREYCQGRLTEKRNVLPGFEGVVPPFIRVRRFAVV